ncbi:MAG: outer membrane beta-barrel protein [Proteobacteria bacterium]|nr:outer membrane beta-barrel protein [Pseudomonadota bacterium]
MAAGNIHIESLKIMPSFTVNREYTDNYFPRDVKTVVDQNGNEKLVKVKKAASVITFNPTLGLSLPFRENLFNLFYHMRSVRFQEQDMQRYDNDSHTISSKLQWHFFSGLTTEIVDNLNYAQYPPAHSDGINRNLYRNSVSVLTSYELGRRYKSELEVTRSYRRFKEDQFKPDNSDNIAIRSSTLYQVMPKTFIGVEYTHDRYNRKDVPVQDTDNTSQNYWFVINFDDPDGRLNGKLSGGTTKIKYDDKTLNTGNSFFGFNGGLTFKKSKYTTIEFSGMRSQSTTGVTTEDAQYGASFKNTTLTLELIHKFTYKISGTVSFSYGKMEFNSEGATTQGGVGQTVSIARKDDVKSWGGGLEYKMRDWLGFKVNYSYTDHNSNYLEESYTKSLFTTGISLKF